MSREDDFGPERPFNAIQWLGVAFIVLAILFLLIGAADRVELIGSRYKDSMLGPASVLVISGAILINPRRWLSTNAQGAKGRRLIAIALLGALLIFGAVLAILIFKGA
jgi:uncharacterized membrane protein YdcZ (DUF606 family)